MIPSSFLESVGGRCARAQRLVRLPLLVQWLCRAADVAGQHVFGEIDAFPGPRIRGSGLFHTRLGNFSQVFS